MPDFLVKADFITIITTAALDNLTDANDAIIETMIVEAILEMTAYLDARYDVTALFAGDGLMHPTLQMYCKDIVLYHLHSRHHQRPMPEIRLMRYQAAIKWLVNIQEQKIDPFSLIEGLTETKSIIKSGGNPKRENHQL